MFSRLKSNTEAHLSLLTFFGDFVVLPLLLCELRLHQAIATAGDGGWPPVLLVGGGHRYLRADDARLPLDRPDARLATGRIQRQVSLVARRVDLTVDA